MNSAAPLKSTHKSSTLPRLRGVSLRSIAWVVLASWLFSLVVCTVSTFDFSSPPAHSVGTAPHSHNKTAQQDACCAILENLSAFSHASTVSLPLQNIFTVLLPLVVFLLTAFPLSRTVRWRGTDPPGKPRHTLTANSLWPHAPPL